MPITGDEFYCNWGNMCFVQQNRERSDITIFYAQIERNLAAYVSVKPEVGALSVILKSGWNAEVSGMSSPRF